MKTSDIPDELFLEGIRELGGTHDGLKWVMRHQIDAWLSERMGIEIPWKVSLAKARRLIKRGWLDGCYCGCRGDYVLPKPCVVGWMDLFMAYDCGYSDPFQAVIENVCHYVATAALSPIGTLYISGEFPKASLAWRYVPR